MNRRIKGIIAEIARGKAGDSYYTASRGERLIAALAVQRTDLLQEEGYTVDEAMERLSANERSWIRDLYGSEECS